MEPRTANGSGRRYRQHNQDNDRLPTVIPRLRIQFRYRMHGVHLYFRSFRMVQRDIELHRGECHPSYY
jgi:hypothetical protein